MDHLRIRTITGADLYLTFLTKKKSEKAKIVRDFVKQHVKTIESSELWRVFSILKREEEMLPSLVLSTTSLEYKNAMRAISNEAEKRRKNSGIY